MTDGHLSIVLEDTGGVVERLTLNNQGLIPVSRVTLNGYKTPSLPCSGTGDETGAHSAQDGVLPACVRTACPNLTFLELQGVTIQKGEPAAAPLAPLPHLHTLRLVDLDFDLKSQPEDIHHHLAGFTHVKHLQLIRAFKEHGTGLVGLLAQLQHQLETLHIRECHSITMDDLTCDGHVYSHVHQLDTDLALGGGEELQQVLAAAPSLSWLRVSAVHLDALATVPIPNLSHFETCFLMMSLRNAENDQAALADIASAAHNLSACGPGLTMQAADCYTPPCIAFMCGVPSADVLAALLRMCTVQGDALHLNGISLSEGCLTMIQPLIDQVRWLVLGGCAWDAAAAPRMMHILSKVETLEVQGPVPWDVLTQVLDNVAQRLVVRLDARVMVSTEGPAWEERVREHLAASGHQHLVTLEHVKRRKM